MPKRRRKPFTLPGHGEASRLAARAENIIKSSPVEDMTLDSLHRLSAVAYEASHHQAGSKEAAIYHIAILRDACERVADEATIPEIEFDLPPNPKIDRLLAMQFRLCESLAVYVERVLGVDRDVTGTSYYLGARGA